MPRRFEQYYKTRRLDNLGDPDWHDRRWQDIDLRMATREYDSQKIDDAVDRIEAVALVRLNDTFSPIIQLALDQLADIGISFTGESESVNTISEGVKTFIITEAFRAAFVVVDYVSIRPAGQFDVGMVCTVTSYNRLTGELKVDPIPGYIVGSGTHASWTIKVSITPNLDTYTRAEVDDKFEAITGNPPPTLNTIEKLAANIGASGDNLAGITNAAAARNNLGLGSVDNTRDINKPVSTATAAAIAAAIGGGVSNALLANQQVQMTNYSLASGANAHSVGPVSIGTGVVVLIPSNSRWVIT